MSLAALPNIKQLTPHITRILGQNPGGFTLQGTNTYLIGGPDSRQRLLVDTGEGQPAYLQVLRQHLQAENLELGAVLITHWHHDHIGGLGDILELAKVPVYKFPSRQYPHESELEYTPLKDMEVLDLFGAQLTVLHTPGHTDDHLALFIANDGGVMLSTDNVLGHGTSSYTDYATYLKSLHRMLAYPNLTCIFPGHGEVILDGPAKIREYINHRLARENQVLALVESRGPISSQSITEVLYSSVPPQVQAAAKRGVDQFLAKLEGDGKITNRQHQYSRI